MNFKLKLDPKVEAGPAIGIVNKYSPRGFELVNYGVWVELGSSTPRDEPVGMIPYILKTHIFLVFTSN